MSNEVKMTALEERNALADKVMSAAAQFNSAVTAANLGGVVVHGAINWLENSQVTKGTPHNSGVESIAVNCVVQLPA